MRLRPASCAPRSSEVHAASAHAARLPCRVIDIPGLALDVDTIDDAWPATGAEQVALRQANYLSC
jgi:hypothetical protein